MRVAANDRVKFEYLFEERLQQFQLERVGSVGFGVRGIVVDFEEEAIDSGCCCSAREERNELGLSA